MYISLNSLPPQIRGIYDAIGGNRAIAMAFSAWSYETTPMRATFAIAAALRRSVRDRVTHVTVELLPSDTYRLTLLRCGRASIAEAFSISDVYAGELRRVIEERTGLHLSLGTMQAVAP